MFFSNLAFSQFSFFPPKPKLKDTINVSYVPQNELLEYNGKIKASVFYFPKNQIASSPKAILLNKNNSKWEGKMNPIDANTVGFLIVFRDSTDKILDNNLGLGFSEFVYDSIGNPLAGAYLKLALSETYTSVNPNFKIKQNFKKQLDLFEKEFKIHPELKDVGFWQYFQCLKEVKPNGYKETIEKELDKKYLNKKDISFIEISMLMSAYSLIGKQEKAERFKKEHIKNEPNGFFAQSSKMENVLKEMDPKKKVLQFEDFIAESPKNQSIFPKLMIILPYYIKTGDWEKGKSHFYKHNLKSPPFFINKSYYNLSSALLNAKLDLPFADSLASESIRLKILENKNGKTKFPTFDRSINEYYFNYASILELENKDSLAYENFKLAKGDSVEKSNPEINEKYILSAIKTGHIEEAKIEGLKIIMAGKSTKKLKFILSDLWSKTDTKNSISTDSLNKIELIGLKKKAESYTEKAEDFTLKDQKGKAWALSSLKGKVVVLDFWATWCGPSIRSFPAMKKAVSKYKNDPNVVFIFVNSWEKMDNGLLQKFIKSNGLSNLFVLFDEKNKVIESLGIKSIPTKVFIDPNGAIRQKISGFDGDNEATVNEISKLIDSMKE